MNFPPVVSEAARPALQTQPMTPIASEAGNRNACDM